MPLPAAPCRVDTNTSDRFETTAGRLSRPTFRSVDSPESVGRMKVPLTVGLDGVSPPAASVRGGDMEGRQMDP